MYNEILGEIKKLRQDLNLVFFHKSRKKNPLRDYL